MRLITPDSLHYPITVTNLRQQTDNDVERNAPLFDYFFQSKVIEGSEDDKEGKLVTKSWPSTFESYLEGKLTEWFIKPGQVVTRRGTVIAEIEEPCKHEVQFGGMCADCGKDMTTVEYNTVTKDTARATVNTVHGHTSLLISQAEASKSDEEAKRRLLSSRKLSLVVDLDQTIIHATVDPTVAEWQNDPRNPNHDAVKDVQAFQLVDDSPGARGCWYYIKLRPGLKEFLETVCKYYELHIYTMGTRAYAQNIAQIVDPERKIFADRILSRDESGSMTVKNLKRLFPVDTKMVVIIDDRGDVWHWSQNLIKVTPYDFFVGIGDINSSFLPKRPELEARPPPPPPKVETLVDIVNSEEPVDGLETNGPTDEKAPKPARPQSETPIEPLTNGDVSAIDQLMSMGGANDPGTLAQQTSQQDEAIAAQLTDRPLMQKQKILEAAEESRHDENGGVTDSNGVTKEETPAEQYRQNLLVDNDTELEYLGRSLREIHGSFFEEYDRRLVGSKGGRIAELRPGHGKKRPADGLDVLPDVTSVMAAMKQKVLKGVSLVFSGVVPLGVDIQNHDLAIWAKSFGASVTENISKRTTHVIASPQRRTAKVRQAAKRPDRIKIVTQHWLWDCLSQWQKIDETPYKIHADLSEDNERTGATNGSPFDEPDLNALLSSSDDEAAVTEEEEDGAAGLTLQAGNDTDAEDEAELAALMPTLAKEDSSPTEENKGFWDDMNDEMADFLGSDADDGSESEAESVKSDVSDSSAATATPKKRKRIVKEDGATDGEESDASLSGSRLQKRKKKALARSTSLNNEAATETLVLGNAKKPETIPETEVIEQKPRDPSEEEEDAINDADLEAELEAEMARQDEEDDDEA